MILYSRRSDWCGLHGSVISFCRSASVTMCVLQSLIAFFVWITSFDCLFTFSSHLSNQFNCCLQNFEIKNWWLKKSIFGVRFLKVLFTFAGIVTESEVFMCVLYYFSEIGGCTSGARRLPSPAFIALLWLQFGSGLALFLLILFINTPCSVAVN